LLQVSAILDILEPNAEELHIDISLEEANALQHIEKSTFPNPLGQRDEVAW
jgi:hypothetical protein